MRHFIFAFAMQMWLSQGTPHTQLSVKARCMIHTLTPCSSPHPWPWALAKGKECSWDNCLAVPLLEE